MSTNEQIVGIVIIGICFLVGLLYAAPIIIRDAITEIREEVKICFSKSEKL